MSEYKIVNGQLMSTDELKHYGVLGMKWGVRRASKRLAKATTKEQRDKAVAKLEKHREKASAKIAKLEKKAPKLQKRIDKNMKGIDKKVVSYKAQSSKYKRRALSPFVSEKRASKLMFKAMKMDAKSDELMALSMRTKNKLENNQRMTRLFKEGIDTIDKNIVNKGKRIVTGS